MPGNKEIYDHLCFSLGWIFSSGGQYHGELPEIHNCYAAGSGGDRLQQRTLSSAQEAYVVSMNLGADDDDDDDVMQVGRKREAAMSRAVASHISSNDERVTEPRCVRSLAEMT